MGKFVKEEGERLDITTPISRTSWLFIHKEDPKQNEKKPDAFKYKVTFMLPKNKTALESLGLNPKQVQGILDEVKVFKKEFEDEAKKIAEAKFKAKWKSTRWNPLLDGDKDKNGNDGPLSGWEGNSNFWILRTKSKFMPTVIDKDKKAIETAEYPEGLYSGCWVRAKVSLYPYDVDGNKGVAAGLGFFIKKIANDEEFKGGANTESAGNAFEDSDLDDIDDSEFEKEFEDDVVEDDEDDLK